MCTLANSEECADLNEIPQYAAFHLGLQNKLGCKDQESVQSSTTPDTGYQIDEKVTNSQLDTTDESQEVRLFQQVTTRHRKRSTKEVPPWNGQ